MNPISNAPKPVGTPTTDLSGVANTLSKKGGVLDQILQDQGFNNVPSANAPQAPASPQVNSVISNLANNAPGGSVNPVTNTVSKGANTPSQWSSNLPWWKDIVKYGSEALPVTDWYSD